MTLQPRLVVAVLFLCHRASPAELGYRSLWFADQGRESLWGQVH